MAIAGTVFPVSRRFIGIANETQYAPGTAIAPTWTFPMTTFGPVDKITYLKDTAWRNAMAGEYNLIQGTYISDLSMGGPFFVDGYGFIANNLLGDYSVAISNPGTPVTPAAAYAAGATQVSVTASTIALNTPYLFYNSGTSGPAEIIKATAGTSTGPYTLTRGLFYSHGTVASSLVPSTGTTAYTHTFALLNSGTGGGGWAQAQPVTQTFTDYTGVPATYGARQYAYTCLSEGSITGTSTGLVEWDAKGSAFESAIATATPTASVTTVPPQAAWNSTVTLGGTQEFNVAEWKLTMTRKLDPKFTDQGAQNPYAIPRGELTAALALMFDPAVDESEYLFYLNNTQPTLSIAATGPNSTSMTIAAHVCAFDTAQIVDSKTVFGYDAGAVLLANTTNVGISSGYGPLTLTLVNSQPQY